MVFSNAVFLFLFLPLTLMVYYSPLCKKIGIKNIWLLLVSLGFYAWGEPVYIFLMVLSIIVNHGFGLLAEKFAKSQEGMLIVGIACLYNLGVLFVFKYLAWILKAFLHYDSSNCRLASLVLPIGISFYTFQALSYVIDVYRGGDRAQKNILNTGLYIAFFPQLIAGPIVRYKTVSEQILNRTHSFSLFSHGTRRFIVGLSKKLLLANNVAPLVYHAFAAQGSECSVLFAWAGALAFVLQIYFDFSGYSDMAIGLGKMFGFNFQENFNYPYISKSITEYWRRWHISLGQWFRDYLYYPLASGPSVTIRKGLVKIAGRQGSGIITNALVLLIVWFATGLWHGANSTFVLWGLLQFVFILWEQHRHFKEKGRLSAAYAFASTFIRILLTKVLFRAESLCDAVNYYRSMFHLSNNKWIDETGIYFLGQYKAFLLIGLLFCFPVMEKIGELCARKTEKSAQFYYNLQNFLLALLFVLDLAYAIGGGYNPFLYFNF